MYKFLACLGIVLLSLTLAANAEQKLEVGSYDIHYVAFPSTFLTPSIANSYGISRSKNIGLVNISIVNRELSKIEVNAVAAEISGSARNMIGNVKPLDFKEVREGKAVYYIAQVSFRNEEHFSFKIEINAGDDFQHELEFSHTFYTN